MYPLLPCEHGIRYMFHFLPHIRTYIDFRTCDFTCSLVLLSIEVARTVPTYLFPDYTIPILSNSGRVLTRADTAGFMGFMDILLFFSKMTSAKNG